MRAPHASSCKVDKVGSILVVRRDNIGDLVCTTPLFAALRSRYPDARIDALANSYNAPVLAGNPHINRVHAYRKLKHLGGLLSSFGALAERVRLYWALRKLKFDVVILAGSQDVRGARIARIISARRVIQSGGHSAGLHEVERVFEAARSLDVQGPIPALSVTADAQAIERVRHAIRKASREEARPLIGLHISARRPSQRWPAEKFARLADALSDRHGASCLLFWSPGDEGHAQHPGDDGKARAVLDAMEEKAALIPWPTLELADLVAGLAVCDAVICSDGGAMHIAAGLGRPVVAFFGDSPVDRWHPWGVPYIILQASSSRVEAIPVEETLEAVSRLLAGQSAPASSDSYQRIVSASP
jgi:ADP-heptose:LPS heptosyltransferase